MVAYVNTLTRVSLSGHEGNGTEGSDSQGAPNLVTGAGAFLQSVVHGYGGVRWEHPAVLTLRKPRPLPGSTYLRLRKLSFMGAKVDVTACENYEFCIKNEKLCTKITQNKKFCYLEMMNFAELPQAGLSRSRQAAQRLHLLWK